MLWRKPGKCTSKLFVNSAAIEARKTSANHLVRKERRTTAENSKKP
jgi:hypothetical protein